jgi:hypothetical protein
MELAEILTQAIADSSALINRTAERWPDRPIQLELHWMPQMGKLDLVIKTVDHLPTFRPKRPIAGGDGDGDGDGESSGADDGGS